MNLRLFSAALLSLVVVSTGSIAAEAPHSGSSSGWTPLFDGKTTAGWHAFGKPGFPEKGWVVEDGWLKHTAKGGGGDIITTDLFENFELRWEWKVAPGANSGVKYFIDEKRGAPIGHEYQLIDDSLHPDALIGPKRQTGSLYDALPPGKRELHPPGQVNTSSILVRGNHVEHWLNGHRILSYEIGSAELAAAKEASKFKKEAKWGTKFATPILLQDHGDEISFRKLEIRRLK
jgi:hypothetical protein